LPKSKDTASSFVSFFVAWSWVEAKLKKKQQVAKDKEELGGGGKKHRMAPCTS
jgi:hypothetical protein